MASSHDAMEVDAPRRAPSQKLREDRQSEGGRDDSP